MKELKKCKNYNTVEKKMIIGDVIKLLKAQPNMTYNDACIILDCAKDQLNTKSASMKI